MKIKEFIKMLIEYGLNSDHYNNDEIHELETFFNEMECIFADPDFTKEQVVESIKRFIPNFEHEEKGKNLDQKM